MNPGTMDRRVTIRQRTQTGTDELNVPVFEMVDLTTLWAQRTDLAGAERVAAGQPFASTTAVFKFWYFEGLLATDEIESDGQIFDIRGIKILGHYEAYEVTAEAQS